MVLRRFIFRSLSSTILEILIHAITYLFHQHCFTLRHPFLITPHLNCFNFSHLITYRLSFILTVIRLIFSHSCFLNLFNVIKRLHFVYLFSSLVHYCHPNRFFIINPILISFIAFIILYVFIYLSVVRYRLAIINLTIGLICQHQLDLFLRLILIDFLCLIRVFRY